MNKYKIVAHMISPDLQDEKTLTKEYLTDYNKYIEETDSWDEFLMKYPIDSNAYEYFGGNNKHIFLEDADGIYLFEKVLA